MPKRKHDDSEEDTLETGNVDQGDFSDGDDSDDGDDGKVDKYDVMREDDIEGKFLIGHNYDNVSQDYLFFINSQAKKTLHKNLMEKFKLPHLT